MQRRVNIQPRFWVFLIAVMVICFAVSFVFTQVRYGNAVEKVDALTQEKLSLINRVNELNDELSYVSTDAYVERVARDELDMILPGEVRYVSN